jgi:Fur family peroxide stress response transcriptional regulator
MRYRESVRVKLKAAGLRLTPQRMAVVGILEGNTSHPGAEDILLEARKQFPMMSFATVYNTLKVLVELGEIQALRADKERTLFDPRTDPHGHFCCQRCGNVIDIESGDEGQRELEGHLVEGSQVFYYGQCAACRRSSNDRGRHNKQKHSIHTEENE